MPEPVSSPGRRTTCKGDLPLVLNGRKSLVTVIAASAIVATVGVIPGGTAQAQAQHRRRPAPRGPSLPRGRAGLGAVQPIHVQLTQMHGDVKALRADQARQQTRTEKARRVVADSIVRQYEGDSLSAVGQAVVSERPQCLRLAADHDVGVQLDAGRPVLLATSPRPRRSASARTATKTQLAKVAALEKEAAQDKAAIAKNLAEAKSLLDKLKADERERLLEASRGEPPGSRPPTSRSPAGPPPPCTTRWPRSASPTSTAPPDRAPSTARA